ncbi:signal transduction histidine kinase/DNA-binding response OmpR family regulator [Duganella sp. 1224]|uniref:hybrid sensor histidine kinase/response regulator n=1 Tax=Duganella sp. 1224 TaxID=2587052 RepID=UPI0015CE569E|nr:hybrid sensor histidine kinase/response regulator [Duganella sp. 1224]NYE59695.1 signal transduction histidine kinase/DNA-binding response OmpR family regulator [Duganella sp. 1224]
MSRASKILGLSACLRHYALLLLLAGCCFHADADAGAATITTPIALNSDSVDLARAGQLFADHGEPYPVNAAGLPAMLARLKPASKVNLLGGSYWLYAELRNDSRQPYWVIDPNDTLIDMVDIQIYGEDGSIRQMLTGYRQPHSYLLHYGKDVDLQPGQRYQVLIRFSSPYYARTPVFSVLPRTAYQQLVAEENVLIIGSVGALLALTVFNFFIYSITRDRSSLYYSMYVLCYAVAWGMTFHLAADLFEWHDLHWHYVPFFLLPVLSTLFYTTFLRLKENAPRLYLLSRVNIVLPLLTLPSCFLALSYAHTIATIVITIWMTMALTTGIVVWRGGYYPARFFVLGFVALMVPGLIILPANVGLIPALVSNAQLFTLLGGTLDGVLLAFALADQIRLLRNNLEQRVNERTAELTEAKEHAEVVSRHRIDFLSAMSHDIRTPLAGVIGMIKFAMRDQSVRGRTEEYLRIGLQNSEALLAILNDILDFSKIDAGRLSIETVDFDLIALIDDAIGILQQQADAKSLLLRSDLALDLPRYVRGDPTRLRQILLNLLGNAIKFTDRGEVRLDASALLLADGHASVTFNVSDTGPGIPADTLPRLFQKFEQADHSTTRRYGGTGLGLAICKELVELMGGAISADSRVGAGSTFSFTLPLALGAAPAADATALPRKEHHAYRLRVLCAEDVRTNQIIVSTLLEGMGHDIRIVENGLQALHALSTAAYDLVLMDGRMPMMDGEQATRLIRSGGSEDYRVLDPSIPIIALTANASDHDRARYLAVGMDGFLSKPVDERLLYDQVEKVIAQHLSRGRPLRPTDAAQLTAERLQSLDEQFGVTPADAAPDTVRIMPLAGLSHKHIQRITQAFLDEAPRRLETARAAVVAGNSGAAAAAIHALKGSAGYLNSTHLHSLCQEMEAAASAGDLVEVIDMLPDVEAALDKACTDLRAAAA